MNIKSHADFDGRADHEDACSLCGVVYEHPGRSGLRCGDTCPACFVARIAGTAGHCEGTE